jgi:hypothetical protein
VLRSLRVRPRRAEAAEDVSAAADTEKTVRAVPRQELVPELFPQRDLVRQDLGRQQSLDQVVVAAVAVSSSQTEHSGRGVGLEHRAHDVRGSAEPVDQRPAPTFEVERGERAVGADPLEHVLGDVGVLGEDARRAHAQVCAEPREIARADERKTLVVRLEELAAFVESIAPGGVVAGDPRVEHQIVVAPRHRQRVELDRAEPTKDLEHSVRPAADRARGREHLPGDEETLCSVGGNVHGREATRARALRASGR